MTMENGKVRSEMHDSFYCVRCLETHRLIRGLIRNDRQEANVLSIIGISHEMSFSEVWSKLIGVKKLDIEFVSQ